MRPILLSMTAFGPYKGTETVNFNELENNRLFVISGATGSGKTTIFDGICFALYGQASGEDRTDFRAMRSDFAEDSTQTEVELTFAIHNRTYRIMRQIPYLKEGNKTETAGRCEFYEVTESGEVPIVDRQIVSEINKKAEDLIGFTQAQFSQIVMLPQGEFRKFLTSDTENKEAIMRKIFKTEPYREIVTRLKEKKDAAYASFTSEKQLSEGHIQQIQSMLPERDSAVFSILSNDNYNTNQVVQALEEEVLYYREKTVHDKKSYDTAYKKHEEMLGHFHTAKSLNERFTELEQRKEVLAKLSERIPFMETEDKRLANAERAALIEEIEMQFTLLKAEVMDKKARFGQATKAVEVAVEKMKATETLYQAEASKKAEREELAESLIRLNDHLPAVSELESKKEKLQVKTKEVAELKLKQTETSERAIVEADKVITFIKEIDCLEEKLIPFDERVDLLNETTKKVLNVDEFIGIRKRVYALEVDKNTNEIQYGDVKKDYAKLENAWLNSQAANLAAALHEGDACPVCGSTDHPRKSDAHEGAVVTKNELETANGHLSKIEGVYRTAVAMYQSAVDQLTAKEKEINQYGIESEDAEEETSKLHGMKIELEEEIAKLRTYRTNLAELKGKLKTQSATAEECTLQNIEVERAVLESKSSLEMEKAIFDLTLQSIPEDVRVLSILQERIKSVAMRASELEGAWEAVQKRREEMKELLTTTQAAEVHALHSLDEAEGKRTTAEGRYSEALRTSDFQTEEAYTAAKMDEEQRRLLKSELSDFKQQLHTIRVAIEELKAVLEGKEKAELAGLEEVLVELKKAYEAALTNYNESSEYEKTAFGLKNKITVSADKLDGLERKYGKITDLYDVVRGHNGLKLSFERYIQIEYLERIIQSANERLKEMSNGQFVLIRSDRQEIRGRQSGLGLDVYDAYTGQTRDVKTLSGGEKFNASLCLALGMADVIQSFQGSVSIETMFIDEGFGSLDEESLNKAIDTLIDLQKSGRMIGVISHVEELKAAFPAILEVKKAKEGHSHTKFFIK